MRLCFIGWGDHVHLERWAGYFAQLGHEVSVISVSGVGSYPSSVRQYVLGLQQRGLRWKILKLRYLLARLRPEVIHAHWAHFAYLAARSSKRPLVVTAWGSDIYRLEEQSRTTVEQLRHGLEAACLITCDSLDQREQLCRTMRVHETKIRVIQWGVDTSVFRPGPADPGLAAELDAVGRPVVLSARHLHPVYNQETVIAAFSLVLREIPDALLVLRQHSSDPPYLANLRRRIEEGGLRSAIRFVGTLPYERVADLFRLADVTVSVPLSDGTPMSILEAMACGSAPVVSDLPSLKEWVRDGWNGDVVPASDASVLAARIARLLKDRALRSAYAQRNSEIVQTRATQQANMATMEKLYREIQQGSPTRFAQQIIA